MPESEFCKPHPLTYSQVSEEDVQGLCAVALDGLEGSLQLLYRAHRHAASEAKYGPQTIELGPIFRDGLTCLVQYCKARHPGKDFSQHLDALPN